MTSSSLKLRAAVLLTAGVAMCAGSANAVAGTRNRVETPGGVANTWSNYHTAGGHAGRSLPGHRGVLIACRVRGFKVADGNVWWYRIATSPWNSRYYVSADAFYNNGRTTGSLLNTPFYDPKVPVC